MAWSELVLVWSVLGLSLVWSVWSVLVWSGLGVRPLRGSPPCSSFWPRTAWRISFILIYFLSACMSVFSFLSLNTHCSLLHTDKSNECTGECVICTIKTLVKVYLWLHVDSLTHTKEKKWTSSLYICSLSCYCLQSKGCECIFLPRVGERQELTTAFSHILCPWLCWWTL